ncbi:SLC13 family permease, partial [Amaricoccus sp. HAR-UPW-R2A-40]
ALGLMPAAAAGLIATCAILLLKILSVEEMYRAINWTTVILIGALMPLSTAISQSGAAQLMADGLVARWG